MLQNKIENNTKITIGMPGMLTTIQDIGRVGFQQYGMPVAGVMDQENYVIGQALIGETGTKEKPYLGALECTMLPPILTCEGSCVVAFTGANMNPNINGVPVPMYRPITCKEGDVISGTYAQSGMRMYIFFAGGIDVPKINGSVATHTKANIGGIDGRKLQVNDVLSVGVMDSNCCQKASNTEENILKSSQEWNFKDPIRVVLGPQDDAFTKEGLETFKSSVYTLTPASDRMGFRLNGKPITHTKGADIISDGTAFGSIQVPADGQPIILMADRQTTGGYTKIGTVISIDLPRLAQIPIGSPIAFSVISVEEAQRLYKVYHENLNGKLEIAKRVGTGIVK